MPRLVPTFRLTPVMHVLLDPCHVARVPPHHDANEQGAQLLRDQQRCDFEERAADVQNSSV